MCDELGEYSRFVLVNELIFEHFLFTYVNWSDCDISVILHCCCCKSCISRKLCIYLNYFMEFLHYLWKFICGYSLVGKYPSVQPRSAVDRRRNGWQRG